MQVVNPASFGEALGVPPTGGAGKGKTVFKAQIALNKDGFNVE